MVGAALLWYDGKAESEETKMNLQQIESFMKDRKPGDVGKRKNCSVLLPLSEFNLV